MKNGNNRKLLQSLGFLFAFIVVCSVFARLLTGSETLAESAERAAKENNAENTAYNIEETDSEDEEKVIQPDSYSNNEMKSEVNASSQNNTTSQDIKDSHDDISQTDADDTAPDNITGNNRVVYQEGFYYEELTKEVKMRINGISYPISSNDASVINRLAKDDTPAISYDDLRYLSILHYDFNGEVQTGELICNKGIADDLVEIFYELYVNEYQIERIQLVDNYMGDDTVSMADNNTSCFNYRVVDGTTSLSKHALGCAIDINPFYNPYVVYNRNGSGETYISPAGSEVYADRSKDFPYKIDENDLCYKLFIAHGFIWGGNWNSSKDYQHFQKIG